MKLGMWLSGNTLNYERQLFRHRKNIAFAMVAKIVKLLWKNPQIKASLMKLISTGADYARHFCRHIKLIVGGCYDKK